MADIKTSQETEEQKKERESSNSSDIYKLIEEISDAQKNLGPEQSASAPREPSLQMPSFKQVFGRVVGQGGRTSAAEGMGSRAAGAGRTAMQMGRLAAQAGSKVLPALFGTPVGWVILAVGAVAIITLIVVLSLGGSGNIPDQTIETPSSVPSQSATPESISPTETPAP